MSKEHNSWKVRRSPPLWSNPKMSYTGQWLLKVLAGDKCRVYSLSQVSPQWKEELGLREGELFMGTTHVHCTQVESFKKAGRLDLQGFVGRWYSRYDFHIGGWYSSASRMKREITSDCMSICQCVSSLEEGQPVSWTHIPTPAASWLMNRIVPGTEAEHALVTCGPNNNIFGSLLWQNKQLNSFQNSVNNKKRF